MAGPAQPLPQGSRGLDEGGCTLAPSCRATAHGHSWLMRARDGGKSRKRSSCSGPSGDWVGVAGKGCHRGSVWGPSVRREGAFGFYSLISCDHEASSRKCESRN